MVEGSDESDWCLNHDKTRKSFFIIHHFAFVKLCLVASCFCLDEKVISRKPAISKRRRSGVMGIPVIGEELAVE